MSAPSYFSDGNFGNVQQNGPTEYSFPFADVGDTSTFLAKVKLRCDQARFKGVAPSMKRHLFALGFGYMVDASDAKDEQCGLLEWTETYAKVPATRTEYGSYAYTQKLYQPPAVTDTTGIGDILSYTQTRNARIVYKYALKPFPVTLAIDIFQVGNHIYRVGGGYIKPGTPTLAEDTTNKIWKGKIYEQKAIYVVPAEIIVLP